MTPPILPRHQPGWRQNSQEDFQSLGRRLDEADALGAFAKLCQQNSGVRQVMQVACGKNWDTLTVLVYKDKFLRLKNEDHLCEIYVLLLQSWCCCCHAEAAILGMNHVARVPAVQ